MYPDQEYSRERITNALMWLNGIKTFWPHPDHGAIVLEYLQEVLDLCIVLEAIEPLEEDREELERTITQLEISVGQVMEETVTYLEAYGSWA